MTRYFYKDPLEAAWMAKYYGMKVSTPHGLTDYKAVAAFAVYFDEHKMFIHPDSLHLLDPQPGDLVKVMGEVGYLPTGEGFAEKYALRSARANCAPHATGFIIQRNGKAFHWSDTEQP